MLYLKVSFIWKLENHENECANILKEGLKKNGYSMYIESPSNQLFPIIDHEMLQKIHQKYITTPMFEVDENHSCIRLVTSWATSKEVCYEFVKDLEKLKNVFYCKYTYKVVK